MAPGVVSRSTCAVPYLTGVNISQMLFMYRMNLVIPVAQFLAVCSSAKPCEIGENLLSVSDPISQLQERLIHVGALVRPPALQRRTVSRLHSYAAMERSAAPMSVVSEPQRWSLGRLPLPARTATLPL